MQNKIIFGTAAFMGNRVKGQEYVIRAIARLKAKGITDIEYRLAGAGSSAMLEGLAESLGVSSQLKVCGVLHYDEIFSWYDGLDVYIQPSFEEALGRAVIEAMSRALPAACSRINGMVEYASKDIMFGAGNVKEIAAVIEKLMNPEVREREAIYSFNTAHKFSKDILDRKRGEFYSEFTGVKHW